ncbi:uncharacterized protein TNCV_2212231 [Trichonephila clavipes]|nr:uncharacterized protein TNCV_2212231 [Trichonephila clavipes]
MQAVETKIRENRRFTIYTLSLEFPVVSQSAVYKIVTEDINFKKLCSQWVPRKKRFAISLDFLIRYEEEGEDMLSRIVNGGKTWVSHITQESKLQSMEWLDTSSPVKIKSQTRAVKAQEYGNSVLGPARCFADGLYATRNNDQLRCNSTEALKSIEKRTCDEEAAVTKPITSPNYYGHLALAAKVAEIAVSLIPGKEFRSLVLGITKRRINNVFCLLPVTTARLETHNVYPDIGARGARSGMRWNLWDRLSDNSSKEQSPIGAEEGQNIRG